MRLSALRHIVESVVALARPNRVTVLGSSSLLATAPQLGEPGGPLEMTFDADLLVEPCDEQLAAVLHEAIGEGSLFAQRTGYYADLLRTSIVETLPPGWEQRLVAVPETPKTVALAAADLLVVKLKAGRAKDLELCRTVLRAGIVAEAELRGRLEATPLNEPEMFSAYRNFTTVLNR